MIELSKICGRKVLINIDLIRSIEKTPDTLLRFTDGETLVVKESPSEIQSKIIDFRKLCQLQGKDLVHGSRVSHELINLG